MHNVAKRVTDAVIAISFVASFGVVAITVVDILLRAADRFYGLFAGAQRGLAITGVLDLSQLLILTSAALAIAVAFYQGTHVAVDLVIQKLPYRGRWLCGVITALICTALMIATFVTGLSQFREQLRFPTTSATLEISYVYFWIPMLVGLGLSAIAAAIRAIVAPAALPTQNH